MNRVYNFSAGPSALPVEVLEQARSELVSYKDYGMSVMEMSHRSKAYLEIIEEAEALLRELMDIPAGYKVLFLQGGASLQFAMIPMNLAKNGVFDYINTGQWSKKAISEGKKFGTANVIASSEDKTFSYIPALDGLKFSENADFVHITQNNTIYGTRYKELPDTGGAALAADVSSCVLSETIDVSRYGLLYAGAQKSIGPAGLCVVIINEALIERSSDRLPSMLSYKIHAENASMYNTPPTYGIYMAGLMFKWVKKHGGVSGLQKINEQKAALLYDYLDGSSLFKGTAAKKDRSLMNIPFVTGDAGTDAAFIKQAEASGFTNLKGHRSVGGMRASVYNAVSVHDVAALVDFMKDFESKNKI